jgi:hypothetical protein
MISLEFAAVLLENHVDKTILKNFIKAVATAPTIITKP